MMHFPRDLQGGTLCGAPSTWTTTDVKKVTCEDCLRRDAKALGMSLEEYKQRFQ